MIDEQAAFYMIILMQDDTGGDTVEGLVCGLKCSSRYFMVTVSLRLISSLTLGMLRQPSL